MDEDVEEIDGEADEGIEEIIEADEDIGMLEVENELEQSCSLET